MQSQLHTEPLTLLVLVSVNVLVLMVAQLVLWQIVVRPLAILGLDRSALVLSCAALVGLVAVVAPVLLAADWPSKLAMRIFAGSLVLNLAVLCVLAYLGAARWSRRWQDELGALVVLAPVLGFLSLVFCWLQIYAIVGVTSRDSLLCVVGTGLTMLLALGGAVALRKKIRPLACLLVMACVAVGAPLIPAAWPKERAARVPVDEGEAPPSVVLLTVDALRADAFEAVVERAAETSGFGALAADSVIFEAAHAPSPWTKASFASMLSGLSPLVHGATEANSRLPDEIRTLAERLRDRGYMTAAIGRNGFLRKDSNLHQGFEHYVFFPTSPGGSFAGGLLSRISPVRFGWPDPTSSDLTDTALRWIRANTQRPFFLWLHYFDPHLPYSPDPDLLPGSSPPDGMSFYFNDLQQAREGHFVPNEDELAWIRALYDAELRDVDASIARVIDALKVHGLYEDSLIVFSSDHGEEFWEHGGFKHGHDLYGEIIRVPLLFKLPGQGLVRRISEPVSNMGVTATVLDVLGFSEELVAQTSLAYFFDEGSQPDATPPLLSTGVLYYDQKIALVFDGFKYIRNERTGVEQLFDLVTDPREKTSLAALMPDRLHEARVLVDEQLAAAAELRQRLDLPEEGLAGLSRETARGLRALGYIE